MLSHETPLNSSKTTSELPNRSHSQKKEADKSAPNIKNSIDGREAGNPAVTPQPIVERPCPSGAEPSIVDRGELNSTQGLAHTLALLNQNSILLSGATAIDHSSSVTNLPAQNSAIAPNAGFTAGAGPSQQHITPGTITASSSPRQHFLNHPGVSQPGPAVARGRSPLPNIFDGQKNVGPSSTCQLPANETQHLKQAAPAVASDAAKHSSINSPNVPTLKHSSMSFGPVLTEQQAPTSNLLQEKALGEQGKALPAQQYPVMHNGPFNYIGNAWQQSYVRGPTLNCGPRNSSLIGALTQPSAAADAPLQPEGQAHPVQSSPQLRVSLHQTMQSIQQYLKQAQQHQTETQGQKYQHTAMPVPQKVPDQVSSHQSLAQLNNHLQSFLQISSMQGSGHPQPALHPQLHQPGGHAQPSGLLSLLNQGSGRSAMTQHPIPNLIKWQSNVPFTFTSGNNQEVRPIINRISFGQQQQSQTQINQPTSLIQSQEQVPTCLSNVSNQAAACGGSAPDFRQTDTLQPLNLTGSQLVGDQSQHSQKSGPKEKARALVHHIAECRKVAQSRLQHSMRPESKTFEGIPSNWHQTIKVRNHETMRVKLYFKCRHRGCGSIFKKSCNLRDHFRKHTGQRPFTCPKCKKTFTQSGNLGRHLKNVHGVPRESISFFKRQSKTFGSNDAPVHQGQPTQKHWDTRVPASDQQDVTISDDNSEGSLVLMTCEEFEKRYPDIAESQHEHSYCQPVVSKPPKIRSSGRQALPPTVKKQGGPQDPEEAKSAKKAAADQDSFSELQQSISDEDAAMEDSSSSYRV